MTRQAFCVGLILLGFGAAFGQEEPVPGPLAVEQVEEASAAAPARREGPRDPFRPFTLDLRPTTEEALTPLQRYELAQLRVTAILLNLNPPRALLEDSSGMGFIVTPGTAVGRRRGVVKAIEPRRIVVEEKTLDFYGREQVKKVALEMKEETEIQGASQE